MKKLPRSSLEYVLLGLIPYSEPNLKLAFKPNAFFNDLEKISNNKRKTLQVALSRAKKRELVEYTDGRLVLSNKGRQRVSHFTAKKLKKDVHLMVTFDIPEVYSSKRQKLRLLLRDMSFTQVQKSVWTTTYDYRDALLEAVIELGLEDHVKLFEVAEIKLN